jgi:hypothetical protein
MTLRWEPKAPTEIVPRVIDWAGILLGDELLTSVIAVVSGGVTTSNIVTDLTSGLITLDVSGGTVPLPSDPYWQTCDDGKYLAVLTNTVTTLAGHTYLETIYQPLVVPQVALPMAGAATKRDIIERAMTEMGLAGYEFDPQPDEYSTALHRLDDLMAELGGPGNNMDLGYNFPAQYGGGDIADIAGVPNFSVGALGLLLSQRLMPAIGKDMKRETRVSLSQAMIALRAACAVIPNRQLPRTTAIGAGNKPYWNVFATGGWRGGC